MLFFHCIRCLFVYLVRLLKVIYLSVDLLLQTLLLLRVFFLFLLFYRKLRKRTYYPYSFSLLRFQHLFTFILCTPKAYFWLFLLVHCFFTKENSGDWLESLAFFLHSPDFLVCFWLFYFCIKRIFCIKNEDGKFL